MLGISTDQWGTIVGELAKAKAVWEHWKTEIIEKEGLQNTYKIPKGAKGKVWLLHNLSKSYMRNRDILTHSWSVMPQKKNIF